MFGIGWGHN